MKLCQEKESMAGGPELGSTGRQWDVCGALSCVQSGQPLIRCAAGGTWGPGLPVWAGL